MWSEMASHSYGLIRLLYSYLPATHQIELGYEKYQDDVSYMCLHFIVEPCLTVLISNTVSVPFTSSHQRLDRRSGTTCR